MTGRQSCTPAPEPLEAFAVQFDSLFGSLGQRRSNPSLAISWAEATERVSG